MPWRRNPMSSRRSDRDSWRPRALMRVLIAGLIYLFASILLTWPLIFELDSALFADFGDSRGWAWWIWAKTNDLLDGPVNSLLAAPFGTPTAQVISQPISEWLVLIFARLWGDIAAMNLFIVLSFALTAMATYLLLARLTKNDTAAFIGGLAFGFCPAAILQAAGGHAAFAFNAFLPLFLLALFHNRERRNMTSALCVALAFAGITFTAVYFGYFALYVAAYFVAFDYVTREPGSERRIARNYLACAVFAALIVFPVEFKAINEQIAASQDSIAKAGHTRDLHELAVFSSRPWDYLLPSIDHPVLGGYVEQFARDNLHGSNVFEQTLYLGMVPLGLLVAGIIMSVCGKFDWAHRQYFLFFAFGALWMYFLSLPPEIGGKVPTLSYFAHQIAPMFRAYGRFGILVNLFLIGAAAVVLAHLYLRMKRAHYYGFLAILLPVLVFEYWSVPPDHALAVDPPPHVYRWLANEPGDFLVAEYPMVRFDEAAHYTYPFWQRIHKKKLVNGASPDIAPAWEFLQQVSDLANPATPMLLKSVGVKYIIVHKRMYEEGPIPSPLKRYYSPERAALSINGGLVPWLPPSLKLHRVFGADMVFELE